VPSQRFSECSRQTFDEGPAMETAGLAVTTRAQADVLLIDEVQAVGDAAFQRKCFEHFRALKKSALKKSDTTIVFVTHDMGAVREFCDRAILIEDSRVVAEGSADDIATKYTELFNPQPTTAPPARGRRRGSGAISYTEVTVPALLGAEGSLTLELDAVAEQDVDEPTYGFVIKSSSGAPVLGTNSLYQYRTFAPGGPGSTFHSSKIHGCRMFKSPGGDPLSRESWSKACRRAS